MIEKFKFHLVCTFSVAIAWVLLFRLNAFIFSALELKHLINWIFLPSGLRLLATLLLHRHAMTGLFLGALITGHELGINLTDAICISLISASTPYIAYLFAKPKLELQDSLTGLTTKQLVITSAIFAVFNSVSHNLYFLLSNFYHEFWIDTLGMFIGDFTGSVLILYIFLLSIKSIRKYVSSDTAKPEDDDRQ